MQRQGDEGQVVFRSAISASFPLGQRNTFSAFSTPRILKRFPSAPLWSSVSSLSAEIHLNSPTVLSCPSALDCFIHTRS